MPLFHFHWCASGGIYRDPNGTPFPDRVAARAHAVAVAKELMRNRDDSPQLWSLRVEDEIAAAFDVFFADLEDERPPLRIVRHRRRSGQ